MGYTALVRQRVIETGLLVGIGVWWVLLAIGAWWAVVGVDVWWAVVGVGVQ